MFKMGIALSVIVPWCSMCKSHTCCDSRPSVKQNHGEFYIFSSLSRGRETEIVGCGYYIRKLVKNVV